MRKYLAVATLVVLVAALAAAAAACGGSGVAGTYKVDSDQAALKDVRMVLADDGTFEISGPDADTGKTQTVKGTYTVDGEAIKLKAEGIEKAETGTVKDGTLVFQGLTWVLE
jgi:hypothetical protein